jgi:hypothetical protein
LAGKSRGCGKCQTRLVGDEAAFRAVFRCYRENAKRTNKDFHLSLTLVRELTSADCFYCGESPSQESKHRAHNGKQKKNGQSYFYNGIDRKNNSLGYTPENCTSCCKICNYMKQELSQQEFIYHIKEILERLQP